ncbi:hypothetical protein L6Q96_14090, partial [Candidatus Binatia bacterium]|nr:hypothetical protein [Candidatus Binatia bacterium]
MKRSRWPVCVSAPTISGSSWRDRVIVLAGAARFGRTPSPDLSLRERDLTPRRGAVAVVQRV